MKLPSQARKVTNFRRKQVLGRTSEKLKKSSPFISAGRNPRRSPVSFTPDGFSQLEILFQDSTIDTLEKRGRGSVD